MVINYTIYLLTSRPQQRHSTLEINTKEFTMEVKKQVKKVKTPNVTALPIVTLDAKEMSVVSGGGVLMSD